VLTGKDARRDEAAREKLGEAALASSIAERRAMEVERAIVDLYRTFMMKDHVGERYEGTVTAIVGSGMFVQLEPGLTGLVPNSEITVPPGADPSKAFEPGTRPRKGCHDCCRRR